MVMSYLRVDNMNIMVLTSTLPDGIQYDTVEPWFNINYTARGIELLNFFLRYAYKWNIFVDIPKTWNEKWSNVPIYSEFSLPSPNPYLTNDFSLLPDFPYLPKYPQKVFQTDLLELWYKQDNKFKFPIAYYNFYFITPTVTESALKYVIT